MKERQWKNEEEVRTRESREKEEMEKKMECGWLSKGWRERTEEINSVGKTEKSQMMEKLMMVQQGAFKISEDDVCATSDKDIYIYVVMML